MRYRDCLRLWPLDELDSNPTSLKISILFRFSARNTLPEYNKRPERERGVSTNQEWKWPRIL